MCRLPIRSVCVTVLIVSLVNVVSLVSAQGRICAPILFQCGGANAPGAMGASGFMNACTKPGPACDYCDGVSNITPCICNGTNMDCCCTPAPGTAWVCGKKWSGTCTNVLVGPYGFRQTIPFCLQNQPPVGGTASCQFYDCAGNVAAGAPCPAGQQKCP